MVAWEATALPFVKIFFNIDIILLLGYFDVVKI